MKGKPDQTLLGTIILLLVGFLIGGVGAFMLLFPIGPTPDLNEREGIIVSADRKNFGGGRNIQAGFDLVIQHSNNARAYEVDAKPPFSEAQKMRTTLNDMRGESVVVLVTESGQLRALRTKSGDVLIGKDYVNGVDRFTGIMMTIVGTSMFLFGIIGAVAGEMKKEKHP